MAQSLITTVESLLNWVPVKPGDTFFAEAGTVHAIGAGITLVRNSAELGHHVSPV